MVGALALPRSSFRFRDTIVRSPYKHCTCGTRLATHSLATHFQIRIQNAVSPSLSPFSSPRTRNCHHRLRQHCQCRRHCNVNRPPHSFSPTEPRLIAPRSFKFSQFKLLPFLPARSTSLRKSPPSGTRTHPFLAFSLVLTFPRSHCHITVHTVVPSVSLRPRRHRTHSRSLLPSAVTAFPSTLPSRLRSCGPVLLIPLHRHK